VPRRSPLAITRSFGGECGPRPPHAQMRGQGPRDERAPVPSGPNSVPRSIARPAERSTPLAWLYLRRPAWSSANWSMFHP